MAEPGQKLLTANAPPLLLTAPGTPSPPPQKDKGWIGHHPRASLAIGLATLLLVAFALGWFLHYRRSSAAADANEDARDNIPPITVVAVRRSPALGELLLPGSLSPVTEASLYARASGYVKRRLVDIGDAVKKGQVLAEIESPELDAQVAQGQAAAAQARQQLNQADSSVGDAQARLDLARVTVRRYETLLQQDSIAEQDVDVQRQTYQSALAALGSARANVGAAAENVRAADANVRRLLSLQSFTRVRAPFDGVITARNFDEGALISSTGASLTGSESSFSSVGGSSGSTANGGGGSTSGGAGTSGGGTSSGSSSGGGGQGLELFRIAHVDRLRVFVTVPQESATSIQLGSDATVFVQEFAERFKGQVSRTARALDPAARTLLTEVQIANADHALMPGMYAQVRFTNIRAVPPLLVPGEALMARSGGTMVAVMEALTPQDRQKLPSSPNADRARRVHLQPVTIGRDYGTEVEITRGLRGGELVVLNPGDTVQENAVMVPRAAAGKDAGDGAGASGGAGQGGGQGKGQDNGQDEGKKKRDDGGGKAGDKGQGQGGDQDKGGGKGKSKGQGEGQGEGKGKGKGQSTPAPVEPPKLPPPPERTAPAGTSASPLGGPSDESPNGLQSPSMAAPSQGQGSGKGGGGKGSGGSGSGGSGSGGQGGRPR